MKSIGVFCGASPGNDPLYRAMARDVGQLLAQRQMTIVYGGANTGLMGALADSALEHGGRVVGVMPKFLQDREILHEGLSEVFFCNSMHERKHKMFELSDGFLALPGGFGTLDEVFEVLSWRQLGFHQRPIGFLNINGFYDHLILLFDSMEKSGLLRPEGRRTALFENDPVLMLEAMLRASTP